MTKLTKFFPTTKEAQDIVLWVDDIEASVKELGIGEAIGQIMDRVISGDLKCSGYVHVIDDNKELATNMAYLLDANYIKEMELMNGTIAAKELVNEVIEAKKAKTVVNTKVTEDKNAAARAFLEQNGAAVVNSKKAPAKKVETKEETKVEETKKVTGRRRISTGAAKQEETKIETTNEKVETKMDNRKGTVNEEVKVSGTRRRVSSAKKEETAVETKTTAGRRQIKRGASMRGNGFQKHEGFWFTNTGLYEGLKHLDSIVDSYDEETGHFSCPELGIDTLVFVEPQEVSRYRNRQDIDVVVQVKSAGAILEFPFKETSSNAKTPIGTPSIGWVEFNGKVTPRFGFWRPNALEVKMVCGCGNKFKANTGNVYCPKCKTRHDDVEVDVEHGSLDFDGDVEGWVFQESPNVVVSKDILAIVMCMAHWEAGYEIDGLLEEDAE